MRNGRKFAIASFVVDPQQAPIDPFPEMELGTNVGTLKP